MTWPGDCARPTPKYPAGRQGTGAGYEAHRKAGEQACEGCLEAHRVTEAANAARRRAADREARRKAEAAKAALQRRVRERERRKAEAEAAAQQRRRDRRAADNADFESRARARAAAVIYDDGSW